MNTTINLTLDLKIGEPNDCETKVKEVFALEVAPALEEMKKKIEADHPGYSLTWDEQGIGDTVLIDDALDEEEFWGYFFAVTVSLTKDGEPLTAYDAWSEADLEEGEFRDPLLEKTDFSPIRSRRFSGLVSIDSLNLVVYDGRVAHGNPAYTWISSKP